MTHERVLFSCCVYYKGTVVHRRFFNLLIPSVSDRRRQLANQISRFSTTAWEIHCQIQRMMGTSDSVSSPAPFHESSSFYGGPMVGGLDEEMMVWRTRRDVLPPQEKNGGQTVLFFINGTTRIRSHSSRADLRDLVVVPGSTRGSSAKERSTRCRPRMLGSGRQHRSVCLRPYEEQQCS